MAEKSRQTPDRRDQDRVQFTTRTDESGQFHERSKGIDSPRTPRPQPTSALTGTPTDDGPAPQNGGAAQPSAAQQDGGPVNYNG